MAGDRSDAERTIGKLSFESPLKLTDNAVTARYGLEGVEPKEIVEHFERHAKLSRVRLCLAINGYYPALPRGPYANHAVQLLIQRAIRSAGFRTATIEEIYEDAICPDELEGFLCKFEEYLLAKDGDIVGAIVPWSCSLADLSEFYEGNLLIDIYAGQAHCACIEAAIAAACDGNNVIFTRVADVDSVPKSGLLSRMLSWTR